MAKQFAEILTIPKTEHHHSHQASNNKPLAKSEQQTEQQSRTISGHD